MTSPSRQQQPAALQLPTPAAHQTRVTTPRGSAVTSLPALDTLTREQLIELVRAVKREADLMRRERDSLATNLDQEEEAISNVLLRKVSMLREEKVELELTLQAEEETISNRLGRQISDLTARVDALEKENAALREALADANAASLCHEKKVAKVASE